MLADDTTILVRGPSLTSLSTQLNEVARTVSMWADNNRMSLKKFLNDIPGYCCEIDNFL